MERNTFRLAVILSQIIYIIIKILNGNNVHDEVANLQFTLFIGTDSYLHCTIITLMLYGMSTRFTFLQTV